MADGRERLWKLDEDGYRYLISKDEHRDIFMLRRKGLTFKAIGDLYQVTGSHARQLVERHMRVRRARVFRYLKDKNNRRKPMTDDLLKRLREFDGWDAFGRPNFVICDEAADSIERLKTALQDIIDERGVCGHCGNLATGRNGGMVDCDKGILWFDKPCKWTQQKPKDIARKALGGKMIDEVTE